MNPGAPRAPAAAVLDVDVGLQLSDGARRFQLASRFITRAPVTALFGPSGAGKSLTLQCIAGLQRPDTGHVRVGDAAWFDAAARVNRRTAVRNVGYLFQHYALFPHLSVRDNVAFGLHRWGRGLTAVQQAAVDRLLDAFGLQSMAASRPRALSGGQQQRVALARALACEPRLLLLDEPFAALNPMLRATLRDDLVAMRARWGIPMVIVTHDVDDVLALADVVLVMDQGAVVQEIDLRTGDVALHAHILAGPRKDATDPLRARLRRLLTGT